PIVGGLGEELVMNADRVQIAPIIEYARGDWGGWFANDSANLHALPVIELISENVGRRRDHVSVSAGPCAVNRDALHLKQRQGAPLFAALSAINALVRRLA